MKPVKGKHYVVQLPATIVSPQTRHLAVCHGTYFVLHTGASRNVNEVENFWILPPDGQPLGEVQSSQPIIVEIPPD